MPVCCDLNEQIPFDEVVRQIAESTRDAHRWQDCFTWENVRGPNGEAIKPSFFPICFEWEQQPAKYPLPQASFTIVSRNACIDRFSIKLSCLHGDNFLTTKFSYDSTTFQEEDIKRIAAQFYQLLQSAVSQQTSPIGSLESLSEPERRQLLVAFNDTETDYPKDACFHVLFEDQVLRSPDSIAAVFEDSYLTYAGLNSRANQLAHFLRKRGVGPDVLVGILLDRSLEMEVGLLGILKAGGAYVPLDPACPKAQPPIYVGRRQGRSSGDARTHG